MRQILFPKLIRNWFKNNWKLASLTATADRFMFFYIRARVYKLVVGCVVASSLMLLLWCSVAEVVGRWRWWWWWCGGKPSVYLLYEEENIRLSSSLSRMFSMKWKWKWKEKTQCGCVYLRFSLALLAIVYIHMDMMKIFKIKLINACLLSHPHITHYMVYYSQTRCAILNINRLTLKGFFFGWKISINICAQDKIAYGCILDRYLLCGCAFFSLYVSEAY